MSRSPAGWASASGWTPQLGPAERLRSGVSGTGQPVPRRTAVLPRRRRTWNRFNGVQPVSGAVDAYPTKPTAIIRARCGSSPESALIANTASMTIRYTRTCAATRAR